MRKGDADPDFLDAVADVRRLERPRRVALRPAPPPPIPLQRQRDERAALDESLSGPLSIDDALDSGEEIAFVREGMSRAELRRLRRGHWSVQDSIDLHGMNRAEALEQVAVFLRASAARGLRCVRIVHGKGLGSHNREPILKNLMRKMLPRREDVLACCQAPVAHGGGGAALVLLKPQRPGRV